MSFGLQGAREVLVRNLRRNAPVLGGDFADWCRENSVRAGDSIRVTWGTSDEGVVFLVTAVGRRKVLALRGDAEVCLSGEDWPVRSVRSVES